MKKANRFAIIGLNVLLPVLACAQSIDAVINNVSRWLRLLIPIVITLALIYFFYGLAKYILNASDDDKKAEGRNIMIYGVIALFVMMSVWGLVSLLASSFGVSTGGTMGYPTVQ